MMLLVLEKNMEESGRWNLELSLLVTGERKEDDIGCGQFSTAERERREYGCFSGR